MTPTEFTIADDGWDRQAEVRHLLEAVIPTHNAFRQPETPHRDGLLLTAAVDQDLIGFLWSNQLDGIGYLTLACVAVEHQGRGVGRALIQAAATRLDDCRQLRVQPLEGPPEARLVAYYERCGFVDPCRDRDPGVPRSEYLTATPADVTTAIGNW